MYWTSRNESENRFIKPSTDYDETICDILQYYTDARRERYMQIAIEFCNIGVMRTRFPVRFDTRSDKVLIFRASSR